MKVPFDADLSLAAPIGYIGIGFVLGTAALAVRKMSQLPKITACATETNQVNVHASKLMALLMQCPHCRPPVAHEVPDAVRSSVDQCHGRFG